MNLNEVKAPFEGSIVNLVGESHLTQRLRELGFTLGEVVRVMGKAPFGDPLMVEIRGAMVALRKKEAECIQV